MANALTTIESTTPSSSRLPEAEVDPIFIGRWSTRAFASRPVPAQAIRSLFEAARWAPSASNLQPWLFIYAAEPEALASARELLREPNQRWAGNVPLLVFVFARRRHPETGAALRTAAFDSGAAWFSLALQAEKLGLRTHAMGGIVHEKTYVAFGVPEDEFESLAAIAVGYPGAASDLPPDLAAREAPNARKSQREFAFAGRYVAPRPAPAE
jgi:nitroreductase